MTHPPRFEAVTSSDGTSIAYEKVGNGPPLVLVHGATVDHTTWAESRPYLETRFTVYAMDRRGRGESGDADAYALEREVEDIVTLVESIGRPVHLLGHSFGGLCSLEASLRTDAVQRLILYEPVILDAPTDDEQALVEVSRAIEAGDSEEALVTFYRRLAHLTATEIEYIRSRPTWQRRVDAAHTSVREAQAGFDYEFRQDRFREMTTPTLLLVGSESPTTVHQDTETLCAALPSCRTIVLEGQHHVAYRMAPAQFADVVTTYLTAIP